MTEVSNMEKADRLVRRRARLLPVLAIVFIAQQAAFFVVTPVRESLRTVDYVQAGAWMFLSLVLILVVATGGFLFHSAQVRALVNDESARAHRTEAMRVGFLAAMAAAILLYGVTLLEPVAAREAIHIVMTAGLAAALLRFGHLERRALGDG